MDSDDDLLELAGVSSGDEGYSPEQSGTRSAGGKKSGVKRGLDDEEGDDDDAEDDGDDYADDMDDEEDEDMDDDDEADELNDPYPLESKYRDEADRAELMAMDEMKREEILYERMQEREKFRERKYLALRAKQSRADKRAARGDSSKSLRTSRLSELKRQRERRSRRAAGDEVSDDDDHDLEELAGYGSEDDFVPTKSSYDDSSYKIASYEEVLKIRTSRDNLSKFLYREEFDSAMVGTLVRLSVGRQGSRGVYRVARIEEVKRGGKIYTFGGKKCNTYLELSQAHSTHVVEMSFVSDSPFTLDEFKIYEAKLAEYQMKLPTVREVRDKLAELKAMARKELTDEDINKMVQRKAAMAVSEEDSANRVRMVTRYREELQVALEQGNETEVARLRAELDKLTHISQKNSETSSSKLAEINIRNQRSNQEYIRRAEQKNVELRRKQLANDSADPFSRLRTNPKLFYKSAAGEVTETAVEAAATEPAPDALRGSLFRNSGVEAAIRQLGIQVDIPLA